MFFIIRKDFCLKFIDFKTPIPAIILPIAIPTIIPGISKAKYNGKGIVYANPFRIIEFLRKPLYFFMPRRLCWYKKKIDNAKHKNAENSSMKINTIDPKLVEIIASKFNCRSSNYFFNFHIFSLKIIINVKEIKDSWIIVMY